MLILKPLKRFAVFADYEIDLETLEEATSSAMDCAKADFESRFYIVEVLNEVSCNKVSVSPYVG